MDDGIHELVDTAISALILVAVVASILKPSATDWVSQIVTALNSFNGKV